MKYMKEKNSPDSQSTLQKHEMLLLKCQLQAKYTCYLSDNLYINSSATMYYNYPCIYIFCSIIFQQLFTCKPDQCLSPHLSSVHFRRLHKTVIWLEINLTAPLETRQRWCMQTNNCDILKVISGQKYLYINTQTFHIASCTFCSEIINVFWVSAERLFGMEIQDQ